jgi:hypothetical protein
MLTRIAARYQVVSNQLAAPEPQPLTFDADGVAQLTGWRPIKKAGEAVLEMGRTNGHSECGIKSSGIGTIASWRTKVFLPPAKYRFIGELRTMKLVADSGDTNATVCLRISGDKHPNKINGDLAASKLEHSFQVTDDGDERELVCELRAHQGEVWFDERSLRLVREK